MLRQHGKRLLAVFGRVHVVAVAAELSAEHPPQIGLVVDDENLLSLWQHVIPGLGGRLCCGGPARGGALCPHADGLATS
jgi:hypothetical protein